jgi:hypothetical protein
MEKTIKFKVDKIIGILQLRSIRMGKAWHWWIFIYINDDDCIVIYLGNILLLYYKKSRHWFTGWDGECEV